MRVLFVTSERGLRGGEKQLLLLRDGLVSKGVEVALCAREGAELLGRFEHGFPAKMANDLDLRGAFAIREAARQFGAELVHAFTSRAHALSQRAGLPLVVTRSVAFTSGKSFLGRRKYRGDARFIAVSRLAAESLRRGGARDEQIEVIPCAIELERIGTDRAAARALLDVEDGPPVLGCVGALSAEKGHEVLLEAAAKLDRKPRLVFVGDGPLRGQLEARTRALGVELTILGWRDDVGRLLAGFDLYVQPSLSEGFGVAAAEAMAAGVPVIASRAGALEELLDGAGWLVPPGDAEALRAAIFAAIADPPAAVERARQGRARVQGFTAEAMADRVLSLYGSVLGRRRGMG